MLFAWCTPTSYQGWKYVPPLSCCHLLVLSSFNIISPRHFPHLTSSCILCLTFMTALSVFTIIAVNGPDTGVTVVYTNQEDRCQFGTIPRIMNINVKCDHKIEAVVSITEPSTCVYDITMTVRHSYIFLSFSSVFIY